MIHGYPNPYAFDIALLDPVWYMMERGVLIDEKIKWEYHVKYHAEWENLQMKLNSVAGGEVNVNSPKQMKSYLYKTLGLPERYDKGRVTTNEDALRNLLSYAEAKHKESRSEVAKFKWLRAYMSLMLIIKIRGVRKMISSYIDIEIDDDGRMRSTLSVGGAETFRFSCSKTLWDTGCNMQTIPQKIRTMFIADPGKEIAEFDLNRGESWVYSHLANEPEMMRIHQEGLDFHTITACAISSAFGDQISYDQWPVLQAANPDLAYRLRYLGKKTNHASAYRMGPGRFVQVVNEEADETGITIRMGQAKAAQRYWLMKYRFIPNWWSDVESQLNESRSLTTPYGRKLVYYDHWGKELFKAATAGTPQSTSVDYINGGMLRVYHELVVPAKYGVQLLHQNHDSVVVQYDEGQRSRALPAIAELLVSDLKVGDHTIQIPVEAQYGHSWGSTTEYKI